MGQPGDNSGRVRLCRRRSRYRPKFAGTVIAMLFIAFAVCGCGQREAAVGKYEAVSQTAEGRLILTLQLQADGKGYLSVENDNAPLRWDLHENTIRLHTQTGGVIQGTWDQGDIQVTMPGQVDLKFTRIR